MSLPSGTRLGPYEVLSSIGKGGMGEVYRAKDTRLDRTVAIKVLPSGISRRDELKQRFDREAKAVSSLSHPNICTLHDVGRQEGVDFLVMEYLEGETLAARLERGPLPLEEALQYASQIADALHQAHRRGIVHRDLKPGNVMLTPAGAKLLDFGLAKLTPTISGPAVSTLLTTVAGKALTSAGTILGTVQYMAPEQLEGGDADARTDIFSFGAVLFEMVTGRKAFEGRSTASLIASILERDAPAVSAILPSAPPVIDQVIRNCLAKDPNERWQSVHDILLYFRLAALAPPPQVQQQKPRHSRRFAWIAASLAILLLAGILVTSLRHAPVEAPLSLSLLPPSKSGFLAFCLSPDGRSLAFTSFSGGTPTLWVRSMGSSVARLLPGTEEASFPFWSPDSRQIAFFSKGKLRRIEAAGGLAHDICDAVDGHGGTWSGDNVILFAPSVSGPIVKVAAGGGNPVPVTRLDPARGENGHIYPYFLPDGKTFLYFARGARHMVRAGSLTERDPGFSLPSRSNALYLPLPSGHQLQGFPGALLFQRQKTLLAQGFDPVGLKLVGDPLPVAEVAGVVQGHGSFSASLNGLLAYQEAQQAASRLGWVDRSGREISPLESQMLPAGQPRLSPDRKKIAVVEAPDPDSRDIWLYDLERKTGTRFTFDQGYEVTPIWSPDGSRILFASAKGSNVLNLYQRRADGAGETELVLSSAETKNPTDWSRDGRYIAYNTYAPDTGYDLWILPLFGVRKPFPFLKTRFNEGTGRFSPDGRWIAYMSNESGRNEVYVQPFPRSGGKWQVSSNGGLWPEWRRDGKELFYVSLDQKLMAVAVHSEESFGFDQPVPLFALESKIYRAYDVGPDGQRFLLLIPNDAGPNPISLLVNWPLTLQ